MTFRTTFRETRKSRQIALIVIFREKYADEFWRSSPQPASRTRPPKKSGGLCGPSSPGSRLGSDAISMTWPLSQAHDAGLEEVEVSATVHLTLTSFSLQIWPSVCPLDHGKAIAASIAALSLDTPLANAATRLAWALLIQASRSARAFRRMMPWNSRIISRASTRTVTPLSMAATVIVSALDSRSRPTVRRRATVRADGARANAAGSAFSAFLRRALHSLTARRQPRNPRSRSSRHRADPFRQPASHCSSSQGR